MKVLLLVTIVVLFFVGAASFNCPNIAIPPIGNNWSVKDPFDWDVIHAANFAAERIPTVPEAALMSVFYAKINKVNRIRRFKLWFFVRKGPRENPNNVWVCKAKVEVPSSLVWHVFNLPNDPDCQPCL